MLHLQIYCNDVAFTRKPEYICSINPIKMNAEELLRHKGLKSTSQRTAVVRSLMNAEQPLSEQQIKEALGDDFDRVTFYRTMKTLQEAQVVHPILREENDTVYALSIHHEKEHAHFVCDSCHKTVCLEEDQHLTATLPRGFRLQHSSIVIHGLCDECSAGSDQNR